MTEEHDQLLADAHALQRLAEHEDWPVVERLTREQIDRVVTALRARGLPLVETEALRAELDVLEWFLTRPAALQRALEEHERVLAARQTNGRGYERDA